MNEQQVQRSERIASRLMRFLAVTGLVAVLALIAWLIIQGVRAVPRLNDGLSAAVSAVTAVFRSAPEEDIVFDLSSRTLTNGQPVVLRWNYTGDTTEPARFSYDCARNVSFSLDIDGGTETLACGETRSIDADTVTVTATSPEARFADVTLHVARGGVEDATLVTVVNTAVSMKGDLSLGDVATTTTDTQETAAPTDTAPASTPAAPAAAPTVSATAPVAPRVRTPADLVVNIVETGVYVDVAGRNTFFPISPIPSDKRAGVVFTVTNRGEQPSGPWGFVANLPIEGDMKYRYNSPVQESLAPGMQVQFTLGFDESVASGKGLVRIEIIPTGSDAPGNNVDAAIVEFK